MAEPATVLRAPALLVSGDKITASHLGRDAYVYVRQSTPTQVRCTPRVSSGSMSCGTSARAGLARPPSGGH
jgi:hypothetical protein